MRIMSGVDGYIDVVNYVVAHGKPRAPRGLKTLDAGFTIIEMDYPYDALPIGCGRKLNPAIGAAEAIQLIGGFSDPKLITRISPAFHRYAEENGTFHGAYGDRTRYGLLHIVNQLTNDRDSRRAVINVWDNARDFNDGKNDYPCTVALTFEIIDDQLQMNVFMRSNDVWLGTPYDWFQFAQLQLTIANILNVQPGIYRHIAASLHIYESDIESTETLCKSSLYKFQPLGISCDETRDPLRVILRARHLPYMPVKDITPSEQWYRELLKDEYR